VITEIIVPVMDQTTESVLLTRWLKREGDAVAAGDALCEIETEKATVEIEAGAAGILRKQLVEAGTQIAPRTIVALVGLADDPLPVNPVAPTLAAPLDVPVEQPVSVTATVQQAPPREIRISPRARRLAEENGIELEGVDGSGPDGRIIEDDIKAAIQRVGADAQHVGADPRVGQIAGGDAPDVGADPRVGRIAGGDASAPVAAIQRAAKAKAERVSLSWRTIPHFHMAITVDLSNVVRRKAAANGVTYTDLFILALAQTLPDHPLLNGHWQNGALNIITDIRIGLVVQTERGLVIPALHDLFALEDIAAEREQIVRQAHKGTLSAAALVEPTFTLTNVGPGHIDAFSAIISPPQVAILAVGSIMDRPVVVEGALAVRPTATFTLGVDHRAIDGRAAQAFLEQLKANLEA